MDGWLWNDVIPSTFLYINISCIFLVPCSVCGSPPGKSPFSLRAWHITIHKRCWSGASEWKGLLHHTALTFCLWPSISHGQWILGAHQTIKRRCGSHDHHTVLLGRGGQKLRTKYFYHTVSLPCVQDEHAHLSLREPWIWSKSQRLLPHKPWPVLDHLRHGLVIKRW